MSTPMILAILNQKGGVGKTTTTVNLGFALAQAGSKVLLADLDLQRDLLAYADTLSHPNLSIASADAATLPDLVRQSAHNFALLDCPPSLSEESAGALRLADVALVPVAAEFPSVRGLARVMEVVSAARRVNKGLRLHLLVTMLDRRSDHGPTILAAVRAIPQVSTFTTVVPRSLHFAKAAAAGESILSYSPRSPGADAYRALAQEILALPE